MDLYRIALGFHLIAGTLALISFWSAGLARKGSAFHKAVGKAYLLAMLVVIVSGVPLVFGLLARGQSVGAIFLSYLLVLVSTGCWSAWRAVRDRRNRRAYFGLGFWVLTGLSALSGLGVAAFGLQIGSLLLQVFGSIGPIAGIAALVSWRRSASDPKWWLKEHYGAMIGNGVATHIAFLGIGLRNLLPGIDSQLLQSFAWFGPLIGAVIAAVWLGRRYGRSPQTTKTKRSATAAQTA